MNTCRPCGIRGIVTEATWVRNDKEVENWYMCDRHCELMGSSGMTVLMNLRQLENATEVRQRQKGE